MHLPMNKRMVALALLALITALALASTAAAPKSMNVLDYYLAMPRKYLRYAGGETSQARQAALYVSDVERGFLQSREPNGEFYSAVALYRKPDGGDLIAVENRECERGCTEEFYLLTYTDGQWADVTVKMLPVMSEKEIRATLTQRLKLREDFRPRLLHKLTGGGSSIGISEYWSGVHLGELQWVAGEFAFKPSDASASETGHVLASVSNAEGDRLEIIGIEPELSNRLPLRGRLNVKVAYQLRSARACRIWARPVVLEERLPDEFTHGSMLYLQGSGVLTTWFGFDNQAHLQQFKVQMVDEEKKNLLTLNYSVDARWEGALPCPTFRAECFPNDNSRNAPFACMVYPSGVLPGQKFDYKWDITAGTITSGQGTRRIILNTDGLQPQDLTVTVDVNGLSGKCTTKSSVTLPLGRQPR